MTDNLAKDEQVLEEEIVINICVGSACHLKGSYDVINEFKRLIPKYNLEDKIKLKGAFCLNHCTEAVSMKINDQEVERISKDEVETFVERIVKEKQWNI
ncbi:(2Fe-2S) ferredoxin domain-containing protein [Mycoplasmatota bacterium WC44]